MAGEFDFMNSPNFGAPGGIRANQEAQMNALSMQEQQGKIAAQPTELALKMNQLAVQPEMLKAEYAGMLAKTHKDAIEAGVKEEELRELQYEGKMWQQQSQMGALGSSGGVPGGPVDPQTVVNSYLDMAQRIAPGAPMRGRKLFEDATRLQGSVNSAKKADAEAIHAQHTVEMDSIAEDARAAMWVNDQAGLDKFNQFFEQKHKTPPPWKGRPYSPELMQNIRGMALTEQQRVQDAQTKFQQDRLEEDKKQTRALTERWRVVQEAELKVRQDEAARREKQGEKVGEPNKMEVEAISGMLKEEFPDLAQGPRDRLALDGAEIAKTIRTRNPNIRPDAARQEALREVRKKVSVLDVKSPTNFLGVPTGSTTTKKTTLAMPMETDPSKRTIGQRYEQGDKVYEWAEEGGKKGWKEIK